MSAWTLVHVVRVAVVCHLQVVAINLRWCLEGTVLHRVCEEKGNQTRIRTCRKFGTNRGPLVIKKVHFDATWVFPILWMFPVWLWVCEYASASFSIFVSRDEDIPHACILAVISWLRSQSAGYSGKAALFRTEHDGSHVCIVALHPDRLDTRMSSSYAAHPLDHLRLRVTVSALTMSRKHFADHSFAASYSASSSFVQAVFRSSH